ncbi:hypothetical protein Ahy_A06g027461 [Arachis hypogaea]|uniref:DRBM domain-containing protein n=2 Tax=Arachis hypogaea TaxID=3818 RepID=A0A445CNR2_ARAHY|nr:hypothetical protein Ahy_A06g027461 [Arachis hypogaea]
MASGISTFHVSSLAHTYLLLFLLAIPNATNSSKVKLIPRTEIDPFLFPNNLSLLETHNKQACTTLKTNLSNFKFRISLSTTQILSFYARRLVSERIPSLSSFINAISELFLSVTNLHEWGFTDCARLLLDGANNGGMYKNRLQELAQRSCFNLPAYSCIREGPDHAPRFKATVSFNGETFESPTFCSTLRQAEHAAAEVALNTFAKRGPSRALAARVLDETGVYKNLLQETAHRAGLNLPVYTTIRSGPGHVPSFSCTVEIAGMYFVGDPARTKKQAQKNAAMAAWSALRKLSEHHLSSSASSLCPSGSKGNEEQEQVVIARVLASLHPSEARPLLESVNQHRWQKSTTTTSFMSTQPIPAIYPLQWQHCGISGFSPEVALYHFWQQEQIMQQQNRLLALTIQQAIPSAPPIYPMMHSVLQPEHCVYFPARELASVHVGPKFPIATSRPSFYLSNQIVPELSRGRSTVTIREIQEEKAEDPPACDSSTEARVLTLPSDDERLKHGGSESGSRNAELGGEQNGNSEWTSHRSMGTVHRPVNINNSYLRAHSEASSNRSFRPQGTASSMVRTVSPTSSAGFRPQHREVPLASRMRTGVPTGMLRGTTPRFMAPPVRIRSVVPVCSAPPPRRSVSEDSRVEETDDLKLQDQEVSRTNFDLGNLRI